MPGELTKKIIDEHEYEFTKLGAKQSVKVFTKILKIIGEPIALSAGAFEGKGPLLERVFNGDALGKAMKALAERMDEDEVVSLMETLCGETACICDGKKVNFNSHYEGRLAHLFKVLKAALEVQYGDFLGEFGGLLGKTAPSPSASAT